MKRSPRPRNTVTLSDSFHQRLNSYALAAGAAAVGVSALAQPAEGKIIYTKTNQFIAPNTIVHLDLNHDDIADFDLKDVATQTPFAGTQGALFASPARSGNRILGYIFSAGMGHKHYMASALFANVQVGHVPVGPRQQFLPQILSMAADNASYVPFGSWCNVTDRYLGLSFTIKGKIHFGWARLNVKCRGRVLTTLTGYAYETIPNKPITTGRTKGTDDAEPVASFNAHNPEPATLGMLALGAPKLSIWRRKESVAAAPERN
jgi:hypothetical protein